MKYRRFGRTDWMVSEIGYGMWGMGGWSGSDDEESPRCSTLLVIQHRRIGLRSTRSISPCSAPSRKAISRLRYLFRPRTASWSIRVGYFAPGPSSLPSTEVSGALIVNAT